MQGLDEKSESFKKKQNELSHLDQVFFYFYLIIFFNSRLKNIALMLNAEERIY